MTESQFQASIIEFARFRGWLVYHTYDSRKSEPGFPDLVMVRGDRILYREVKTDKGRLTEHQKVWAKRLFQAGGNYGIWRPSMKDAIWQELM